MGGYWDNAGQHHPDTPTEDMLDDKETAIAVALHDAGSRMAGRRRAFQESLAEYGYEIRKKPDPKPDGWHTYHVCQDKLRELKIVTAPNGQTSSLCPYCGEWFRARIER